MAYRSQLVVRTKEPKGARIIDRVKELAELESKTFSEKAIEILERGLGGLLDEEEESDEADEDASGAAEQRSESSVRRDPMPAPLAPPEIEEKSPDVRPDESPSEAAERGAKLYGDEGAEAAAKALTKFFAAAEPVDGANIREELQDRLNKSEYEELMEALKQTEEYRAYRKRVVYASW